MIPAVEAAPSSKKDAPYVAREAVAIPPVRDDHITAGEAATVELKYEYLPFGKMGSHNLV